MTSPVLAKLNASNNHTSEANGQCKSLSSMLMTYLLLDENMKGDPRNGTL